MELLTQIRCFFVMLIAVAALAACGGGSSGGSSGSTGSTAPDVQITNTNSQTVARDAYQSLDASDGFSLKSNRDTQSSSIVISSMPKLLRDIVVSNSGKLNSQLAAKTDQCAVFGSITSPDTTTGLGTYSFNNCIQTGGTTFSGSVVISGSGDLSGDTFSGGFAYNQFSISGSSIPQTITVNGSIAFAWSTSAGIETGTVSGSYTVTVGATSISVSGLSSSYTDNSVTGLTTDVINYTVTSSAIGGTVAVTTISPIISLESEDYPRSGQLLITGFSGSKLRLTVLGSGQSTGLVRIEVDSDGDSVYEDSREVSWATLDS
jgi:hypothetical protein